MRFIFFVLILLTALRSLAANTIVGSVEKDSTGIFLKTGTSCLRFKVQAYTTEAEVNIRRLSSGDSLTASGRLDISTCVAEIDSVDYVGLKKMLGHWHSNHGLITVNNFSSLNFYPITTDDSNTYPLLTMSRPVHYRYSLTPADGKDWVLFLSDRNTTAFATIRFQGNRATMKIYDSDTGKVNRTLYLSKWRNLKQ